MAETTTIIATEDLYNDGKCFTKDKEYTVNRIIRTEASLLDSTVVNDLGQQHIIGIWWRKFKIKE